MTKRLNVRVDQETYEMLAELRFYLRSKTDSDAIRTLIRLHHYEARAAIRRLRKALPPQK